MSDRKCFIMLCLKTTQQECIDRKLFGEVERSFDLIKALKPGDIGFLFNMDTNALIGPFEAVSEPGRNLEPQAWKGKYPAQIRVKLHTRHLKQMNHAREVLEPMGIEFDELRLGKLQPRLPVHDAITMRKLTDYILKTGVPFSAEAKSDPPPNETGNEVIDLYAPELPDGYIEVLNEVAIETRQKTLEKLPTKPPLAHEPESRRSDLPRPFNICVLGEVTNEAQLRLELGKYFQKKGVSERDWNTEFFSNEKIKQGILSSLKRGQSKFGLIVTGQIYRHSNTGAKKQNIDTELTSGKYIDYRRGSDPRKELDPDKAVEIIDRYIRETFR